jgi:hypothetical protein
MVLTVTWIASYSCFHCTEFEEEWEEIKKENVGFRYVKLFLEDHHDLIAKHSIDNIPCFLFSEGGRYYDSRVVGPYKHKIVETIYELSS